MNATNARRWLWARRGGLAALLVAIGVFLLTFNDRVWYTDSDPQPALLVSQAILEHGDITLDPYLEISRMAWSSDKFIRQDGHVYYYFPLGTSLLSLPVVWVANRLGWDMAQLGHNYAVQNLLSALVCAAVVLLIYGLSRRVLPPLASLLIAALVTLGSGLVSTLGSALWSFDYTVLAMLGVLWLLLTPTRGPAGEHWQGVGVGVLLFTAYLCRPTAAVFILCVLVYLLLARRPLFRPACLSAASLLGLYLAVNWVRFGALTPAYYTLDRFAAHSVPFWRGLYGHFLSPSRGLLVFSPMLALPLLAAVVFFPHLRRQPLFWLAIAWFGLHLVVVSRSTRWWGSWSFGPRVLVDALPALVLLTVLAWQTAREKLSSRRWLAGIFIGLSIPAIAIHSGQGLFNLYTKLWNGGLPPNIDAANELLFDWRTPQWLANEVMLCSRNAEYSAEQLATSDDRRPYRLFDVVWTQSRRPKPPYPVTYVGMTNPNVEGRWVACPQAELVVRLAQVDATRPYRLRLSGRAWGEEMDVGVEVNGNEAGKVTFKPGKPQSRELLLPPGALMGDAINRITLRTEQPLTPTPFGPYLPGWQLVNWRLG